MKGEKLEDGGIDAGLIILSAVTFPGHKRTVEEIAYVCGCSRSYIEKLENMARKKLREEFIKRGVKATF